MTRNFTSSKSSMSDELDLDSFLRRHNATSSSDDDEKQQPQNFDILHRTVDDILNDSSSDSDHEVASVPSYTKTLNSGEKQFNSTQTKYNLIQRLKSDELGSRKPPKTPQNSRNSSIFGGGVSRKPGAALAAAAAASRNVWTPRTAARRALSVSLEGKVSDGDELLGFVRDDVKSEGGGGGDGDGSVSEDVGEVIDEREIGVDHECGSVMNGEKGEVVSSFETSEVRESGEESSFERAEPDIEGFAESNEGRDGRGGSELMSDQEVGRKEEFSSSFEKNGFREFRDVEEGMGGSVSVEDESVGGKRVSDENSVDKGPVSSLEGKAEEKEEQESGSVPPQVQRTGDSEVGSKSDRLGAGGDEISSTSDDVEGRIAQLEGESDSEKGEETLGPVKKPLELAEELEMKQASTGQDWEEGAAAQPMRLEGARRSSTVLGYFDVNADNSLSRAIKSQAFIRDYGMPQVIVVHLNYIALGMSKGVVVVVPSKFSAQHSDEMDPKMLLLGAQADRSQFPVTSICFNKQGDLLLAGYGDGHVTLWNVPRGTVARVITGEHAAPVIHTLFLGQDSQVTRQFKAVTGDCKGLVQLHEFSFVPIIGVTVKTQCLLDGQRTGTVLCASPLLPDEFTFAGNTAGSSSSIGSVMGGAAPWKFFNEGSPLSEEGETHS